MTMDAVLLLHGLGRTRLSMALPSRWLSRAGFHTINLGYPSRRGDVDGSAAFVAARLPPPEQRPPRLHVLTHSMGGVVFRRLHTIAPIAGLGRVVMLSPPNRGSRLARKLGRFHPYRWILGPAITDLGGGWPALEPLLGRIDFDLGVITGEARRYQAYGALLPEPSDGKVEVGETEIDGMKDFLVVPSAHTFIMNRREVLEQAEHFFRHGRFSAVSSGE